MELKDLVNLTSDQYKTLKNQVEKDRKIFLSQNKFKEWYRLTSIMAVIERIYEPEHEDM